MIRALSGERRKHGEKLDSLALARGTMPDEQLAARILGIDPGTASVGYGLIDCLTPSSYRCLATGIIQTARHLAMGDRLRIIRQDVISLIEEFRPHLMSLEAIFFFKNAKTLVPVAQARGVILESAASMGLPVFEYTPMQVKLNLTGFGRADKRDVQLAVSRLIGHEKPVRPDDAADALALAICHARLSINLRLPVEETERRAPDGQTESERGE